MDVTSSLRSLLPYGRRSIGINQLISKVEGYLPPDEVERVQEAYDFAFQAHEGQRRRSGEPYITHPVAVAGLLADLKLDSPTLIAAMLHDVIEDTPTAKEEITARFGTDVAELVDGVSKLDQIQFRSRAEAQAESFRKMLLAMVRDIRVIMVKLADRTHNMRTLGAMPPAKRRTIARETLEIYAPIANRLGMHAIKRELEDLGFRSLYPRRYKVIETAVRHAKGNQKQFVERISTALKSALDKVAIPARIEGREKDVYSIYEKMRRKKISLTEIVDVYGLRIIVGEADTCYRTLGVVHSVFKPMPGRFKDYIAIPRVNGYQSLHTTLFGPNGTPIEVQIRTEEMHRVAESGIAAHWQYKEGETGGVDQSARAREWLQQLMEIQQGGNSEEFLESVKVDLFPDKVYVFTPKGEIRRLPRGSTCVDFAYDVHTDVGNRCVAAKVDRRLVPLRTALRNGQSVEIITAKGATPNPAWAAFVVTAKARAAIQKYLKNLKRGEAVDLGKRLVNQSLEEFSQSLRKVPEASIQAVARDLGLKSGDELFEKVGLGERVAPFIARRLLPPDADTAPHEGASEPLTIEGTEGLVVTYARCCFPIPNDPILASLSSGRGVVIHREACGNLASFRKQPEKWISVAWKPAKDRLFHVEIRIEVSNRVGVLAQVASAIAGTQTNIDRASVVELDSDTSTLIFELLVHDRKQLARVIRSVRGMKEVLKVTRTLA
ncbi:MAG TPA: RelA/SpoT family protein [Steroidobacteraceae bacterium]|nr:RelA/SpoT family protein [Steroidobacteraceae bacterium]